MIADPNARPADAEIAGSIDKLQDRTRFEVELFRSSPASVG
jgi:hypothetical protein